MKVGQERIHHPKPVAGVDEDVRLTCAGLNGTVLLGRMLRAALDPGAVGVVVAAALLQIALLARARASLRIVEARPADERRAA